MDRKQVLRILDILEQAYPEAACALEHQSAYELLVATILSAQCTDARVNIVTKELFKEHCTPQTMLQLSQGQMEGYIHSCGFYRNKAKNILAMSEILVKQYDSQVPKDIETLRTLPGVGRKTANVVASVAFGVPAIAVDTHVFRVANRMGLAHAADELHTELQLMENIPQELWSRAHHLLIFHGRHTCSARAPRCERCPICKDCEEQKAGEKINVC